MAAEPLGMAELRYAVILEPEPDGSAINVIVPAFPEIHTYGATVQEALEMARDAIELSLEYRRDKGLESACIAARRVYVGATKRLTRHL